MVRELHRSSFGDGSRISIARNSAHSVLAIFDGHDRVHARVPLVPKELRALAKELQDEADAISAAVPDPAEAAKPADPRFVYGVHCRWFGPISAIGINPGGLPVCPHCGSPLFECANADDWWTAIDKHEANGNPGYRAFVEWMADKHFLTVAEAKAAYAKREGGAR